MNAFDGAWKTAMPKRDERRDERGPRRESPFYYEACVEGGYYCPRDMNDARAPMPGYATRRLCNRFFAEKQLIPQEAFRVKSERSRQLYAYICGAFVDESLTALPIRKVLDGGFKGIRDQGFASAAAELQYGRCSPGCAETPGASLGPHGQGLRLFHAVRHPLAAFPTRGDRTASAQVTGFRMPADTRM